MKALNFEVHNNTMRVVTCLGVFYVTPSQHGDFDLELNDRVECAVTCIGEAKEYIQTLHDKQMQLFI